MTTLHDQMLERALQAVKDLDMGVYLGDKSAITDGVMILACMDLETGDESVIVAKGERTSMVSLLGLLAAGDDIIRGRGEWASDFEDGDEVDE